MTFIIGVKLGNRVASAPEFQKISTKYGCIIKTRLGLHEVAENICSTDGVILLEVINEKEGEKFAKELTQIPEAKVQTMKF